LAYYLHLKYTRGDIKMNLGWICGFFIGILGIIGRFTWIPWVSPYNYWLLLIGFFLVALSGGNRRF